MHANGDATSVGSDGRTHRKAISPFDSLSTSVFGPTVRVAEDVPGLVDADHLADIATEVGMMPPSKRTIRASDHGRIRLLVDTKNFVQRRQLDTPA
jgi:hypothetical protein